MRKRRTLQGISAFCCASFIGIQIFLVLLWCQPRAFSISNGIQPPYTFNYKTYQLTTHSPFHTLPHPIPITLHPHHNPHHDPPYRIHPHTPPHPPLHPPPPQHPRSRFKRDIPHVHPPTSEPASLSAVVHRRIHAQHRIRQPAVPDVPCRHCCAGTHAQYTSVAAE
jgi:hypothetical protein